MQSADTPGVAILCPVIRRFTLTTIDKGLLEQSVAIAQTVSGERDAVGCGAVQKAGCETPETTVSEGVILDIFQNGKVNPAVGKKGSCFFENLHTKEIIENHSAGQILRREIECLPIVLSFFFRGNPGFGDLLHASLGKGIVELIRIRFLQMNVFMNAKNRICTCDKCFRIGHSIYLP